MLYRLPLLFLLVSAVALGNGSISGTVADQDGLALRGATIQIKAQQIGTYAGQDGTFSIVNVPTGTHEVTISYIGFEEFTQSVSVTDGKTAIVTAVLKPAQIEGEQVVVLGSNRLSQARALTQQRNNVNITNVVSSDQMGRFPDQNIGDALKRIPAITVNYDQGEARFANIRGTAPRLNSITVNGERVPSAEAETRVVQLDLIPTEMIQTIEVNKAVTPDMDADAIGGSVNLVTRAVPGDTRISATLGSGYNFLSEEPQLLASGVVGTRLIDDKLGVVLSGSFYDHKLGSDNAEGVWVLDDNDQPFVEEWDVRAYEVRRIRRSISGALDYELATGHNLYFNALYNHRDDYENRFRLRSKIDFPDENGVSEVEVRRQTKAGSPENDNARLEDQRTQSFTLSGDHLVSEDFKIDWLAGYAKASEERPNERYISWRKKDVPMIADLSNPENPYFNPVDPEDLDLSTFELREITEEYQYTEDIDMGGRLNLSYVLGGEGLNKNVLKVGGRIKMKEKSRNNEFAEFEPISGFENILGTETVDKTDNDFDAGAYESGLFTSPEYLGGLDLENSDLFEKSDLPEEYVPGNFTADETVTAFYAMVDYQLGANTSVIAGARVEMTDVDYQGFDYDIEEEEYSATTGEDSYTNVLPGIHVRHLLDELTMIRFAWTNTISRPNYYDLVPYRLYNSEDQELEIGNPSLEPTTSMNFDLMGERYFENIGLLSAGVFYKDIQDYIFTRETNDFADAITGDTVTLFVPDNGATASLFGFEFAFQRQLDFIASELEDVTFFVNYTYTSSTAENPDFSDEEISLPGTAEHTVNLSLQYETEDLSLGLSFNHTGDYLDPDELDLTPGLERYHDASNYLDFNGSVQLTSQLQFFVEVQNILNQPLRFYAGDTNRTAQAEYYRMRASGGIKFNL